MIADLVIGQEFQGSPQMFFDSRIARFELRQGHQVAPYVGRMGDIPALTAKLSDPGLLVIVHQTRPSSLKYHDWAKFQEFIDEKALGDVRSLHQERGLPDSGFYESYARYAKALVAIGAGDGTDQATGMEIEFVAGANPYTDDLSRGLPIQLWYQGRPLPDTQITVFDRAPDGQVRIDRLISDASGKARVPTRPGHSYLLDAVVLRPAPQDGEAVWETLWAALSFFVPER